MLRAIADPTLLPLGVVRARAAHSGLERQAQAPHAAHVRSVFAYLDADGSGTMSPREFFKGLRTLGRLVSIAEAEAEFARIDTNGDGQLNLAEWEAYHSEAAAAQEASANVLLDRGDLEVLRAACATRKKREWLSLARVVLPTGRASLAPPAFHALHALAVAAAAACAVRRGALPGWHGGSCSRAGAVLLGAPAGALLRLLHEASPASGVGWLVDVPRGPPTWCLVALAVLQVCTARAEIMLAAWLGTYVAFEAQAVGAAAAAAVPDLRR